MMYRHGAVMYIQLSHTLDAYCVGCKGMCDSHVPGPWGASWWGHGGGPYGRRPYGRSDQGVG